MIWSAQFIIPSSSFILFFALLLLCRQDNRKRSAAAGFRRDCYGTVVIINRLLHDSKAQTRSGVFRRIIRLEYLCDIVNLNTLARIGDFDPCTIFILLRQPYFHGPALAIDCFHSVNQKVCNTERSKSLSAMTRGKVPFVVNLVSVPCSSADPEIIRKASSASARRSSGCSSSADGREYFRKSVM